MCSGLHFLKVNKTEHICTGKSLSEVLIYSSINPQYDNRLFNDLRVQYEKITRSEHVENMSRTCQQHVMYTNRPVTLDPNYTPGVDCLDHDFL